MGNQQSLLQDLQDINEKQRQALIDLEHRLKSLEQENYNLKKEIKKYEKQELLNNKPRPEREEDIL